MLYTVERFGCQPESALRSPMDARPVAILNRVNPSESIHPKTQTYLTPLESHSCNMTQYKIFRITFLRKNRGRGGHSVNQLPETGTSSMSFPRPTSRRGLFFPFNSTVDCQPLPAYSPLPRLSATLIPSHSNRGLANVSRHAVPCHRGAGPRRLPAHRKPRPQSPSHPRSRPHRHRHHRQ